MSEIAWEANGIRLALFPTDPLDLSADFWRSIFSIDPDSEETRPREGTKRQVGPWQSAHCEIQANPARLDIVAGPRANEPKPGQMPSVDITIGPAIHVLDLFQKQLTPWLAALPFGINRLGLSGAAVAPASSQCGTYEILAKHIRSASVRPGAMREFMYRVNWPKPSDLVGYNNDLLTWSSMQMTLQMMNVGSNIEITVREEHFAQLQFDASTPADRREPLEQAKIAPIFEELVGLVRMGVIEGERPSDA